MYMHACIQEFTKNMYYQYYKKLDETTRGEMGLEAKRLGCGGETNKGENRGETTWGKRLGAKRLVTL